MGAFGRHKEEEGAKREQPKVPAWRAVRTTRWLFVDDEGGPARAVRPQARPAELNSLGSDPHYRVRLRTLRRILADLSTCSGRECQEWADASVR